MTSPILDCLNQGHALPPRLEDLILAELFLAGGPCYIHRLWAEMFERQKSISVGSLLFTQEVMQLERQGLLKEAGENKTAITKQGEVHLFALVLLRMIPAAQARRMEAKGVLGTAKISASGGLGGQLAIETPAVTGNCPNRGRDPSAISSAAILGVASVSPAPASGQSCAGSNGGGALPIPSPPKTFFTLEDSAIHAERRAYAKEAK